MLNGVEKMHSLTRTFNYGPHKRSAVRKYLLVRSVRASQGKKKRKKRKENRTTTGKRNGRSRPKLATQGNVNELWGEGRSRLDLEGEEKTL